jgi:hypothetical protein
MYHTLPVLSCRLSSSFCEIHAFPRTAGSDNVSAQDSGTENCNKYLLELGYPRFKFCKDADQVNLGFTRPATQHRVGRAPAGASRGSPTGSHLLQQVPHEAMEPAVVHAQDGIVAVGLSRCPPNTCKALGGSRRGRVGARAPTAGPATSRRRAFHGRLRAFRRAARRRGRTARIHRAPRLGRRDWEPPPADVAIRRRQRRASSAANNVYLAAVQRAHTYTRVPAPGRPLEMNELPSMRIQEKAFHLGFSQMSQAPKRLELVRNGCTPAKRCADIKVKSRRCEAVLPGCEPLYPGPCAWCCFRSEESRGGCHCAYAFQGWTCAV